MRRTIPLAVSTCLLLAACDSDGGSPAQLDSVQDAGGDLGPGLDAAEDTSADTAPDVVADVTPDIPDTTADVAPDGALDTVPDDVDAGGDTGLPAAWLACAATADCAVFEVGCCDHCNGGSLAAANQAHLAEAKAKLQATNCQGVACTEKACANAIPVCQQGQCAWAPDPAFPFGCKDLGEADCKLSAQCLAISGAPATAYCAGESPAKQFLGCKAWTNCGQAFSCTHDPETGAGWILADTCAPEGWTSTVPDTACCAAGTCAQGNPVEPAQLCVRGLMGAAGEELAVGAPIEVQVTPKGCWSSSCTTVHTATCSVTGDAAGGQTVAATFCLEPAVGPVGCTADFGGGGFAKCQGGTWTAGTHQVQLGATTVKVTVPGTLPFGGACAGSPF